jgi:hypothetical protein
LSDSSILNDGEIRWLLGWLVMLWRRTTLGRLDISRRLGEYLLWLMLLWRWDLHRLLHRKPLLPWLVRRGRRLVNISLRLLLVLLRPRRWWYIDWLLNHKPLGLLFLRWRRDLTRPSLNIALWLMLLLLLLRRRGYEARRPINIPRLCLLLLRRRRSRLLLRRSAFRDLNRRRWSLSLLLGCPGIIADDGCGLKWTEHL